MILEIFFLKISNADISFGKKTFTWKSYTINEILPTTKQFQIIDPKELIILALDVGSKIFVIYVTI